MKHMPLLRMKEAAEYSGLHPHTLRKYVDQGIIQGARIGTHRYVDTRELDRIMGRSAGFQEANGRTTLIYARVSTRKQNDNLERQKQRLLAYCAEHGLQVVEVITEIASGINENRRGLKKLLKLIRKRKAKCVVIEYKDRLARLGLNYLLELFKEYGIQLLVVQETDQTPEEELVQDLITIVTSYSARIYGKRGAQNIIKAIKE
jgi:putative resolvase